MTLLLASTLKMLVEIALMALLAQSLLGLLLGQGRAANPVFQVLQWLTQPLLWPLRRLQPGAPDARLRRWLVLGLVMLWVLAAAAKVGYCLRVGLGHCA
ncbi:YggT family protein [Paucibacter sp. AS339]|uniref:YggT family protein n=1 Tax=Paucibacter hankyongi TaxID=3133434 RepID=UPI0030958AFC